MQFKGRRLAASRKSIVEIDSFIDQARGHDAVIRSAGNRITQGLLRGAECGSSLRLLRARNGKLGLNRIDLRFRNETLRRKSYYAFMAPFGFNRLSGRKIDRSFCLCHVPVIVGLSDTKERLSA